MLFSKGLKKPFPPVFSFPLRLPPFLTNGCCPSATMVEALPRIQTVPGDAAMTTTLQHFKNKHYFFDFLSHFSGDGFSDPPPLLMSPPSALTRNSPFLQQASRQLGGGERGRCPNGGAFFRERAPSALVVVVVVGSKGGGYVSLPSTSSLQSHSTVHLLCSRAGKEAPFLL